jgi:hypothetical protein
VLALAACSVEADDTALPSTTTPAPVDSTAAPEQTSTTQPTPTEAEEVPTRQTLDPAGSVDGGTVSRSYIDGTHPPGLAGIVGLAISDLADRLAIDESAISVVLVEEVVWSDASLGCPRPGMAYAQVLTDGMRIVLEADGLLYDYRSGGVADPVLCEQAVDKDNSRGGIFELTEEGGVIFVPTPGGDGSKPPEGIDPPDK